MEWRGFDVELLNDIKAKHTYNELYPIIFPMYDNGTFKGWVSRTTDLELQKQRKYLYNKGFSRRNTVVGDYNEKENFVVLVEGYMDMLKARQYGAKNVCAILGWKITLEQVEKLKKAGIKNVISALDNDKYGRQGTKYLKQFFNVARFNYPDSTKDMGDISKKDFKEEMKNVRIYFENEAKHCKKRSKQRKDSGYQGRRKSKN